MKSSKTFGIPEAAQEMPVKKNIAGGRDKQKKCAEASTGRRHFFDKRTFIGLVVGMVFVGTAAYFLLPDQNPLKAATASWLQTDWSGVANTTSSANSVNAAAGAWKDYFFKSSNVDTTTTPGQVSLTSPTSSITKTTNADFNAGNVPLGMRVLDDALTQKKQDGRPCTTAAECATGVCTTGTSGVCGNWYYGYCDIAVYNSSAYTYWKNTQTACEPPQCSSGVLSADNVNVDFSLYAARNNCRSLGGRMPSVTEMKCINTNKAHYTGIYNGTAFMTNKEYNLAYAVAVDTSTGNETTVVKTSSSYYICVKDL